MTVRSIGIIARREIRDTLSDWRLLLPIVILSLVFPAVLVAATNIFINFIDEPNVVRAIVPFAMLLIGFIPASFSLITALESFVGERERNSLEALLAMPISDGQLYIGKLLSALLPPLGSALVAMGVFALLLRLREPALFAQGLKTEYAVTIVLLLAAKAVLMVAGAVIISSHTSSIRAANLLASFVLLPTAALIQVEALYIVAGLWWQLRIFALALAIIAAVLVRTGMNAFNREEILSREHEQFNLRGIWRTFKTYLRAYHPVEVPASAYVDRFSLNRFYRRELPALLRDFRLPLAVACIAALCGIIGGVYVSQRYQLPWLDGFLDRQIGQTAGQGVRFGFGIFFNNIRVALLSSLLSALSFGLFAFLVPAVAFGQVALVTTTLAGRGTGWVLGNTDSPLAFLVAYILPHGIIELPVAILAAALGIRMGASLMPNQRGVSVGQNMLWALAQFIKVYVLVIVPLYLLAALLEGLVTPIVVRLVY